MCSYALHLLEHFYKCGLKYYIRYLSRSNRPIKSRRLSEEYVYFYFLRQSYRVISIIYRLPTDIAENTDSSDGWNIKYFTVSVPCSGLERIEQIVRAASCVNNAVQTRTENFTLHTRHFSTTFSSQFQI